MNVFNLTQHPVFIVTTDERDHNDDAKQYLRVTPTIWMAFSNGKLMPAYVPDCTDLVDAFERYIALAHDR